VLEDRGNDAPDEKPWIVVTADRGVDESRERERTNQPRL
jgi:hypothetical protein